MNTYQTLQQKMLGLAFILVTLGVTACNLQPADAQQPSATEQNKQLIQEAIETGLNRGDMDAFDEFFGPDFIEHEELPPGTPAGREGVKAATAIMRTAFPDLKITIADMVAEGDKVAVRLTWSGTQDGEFMGMPPTGKSFSMNVMDIFRIEDGKIAEHWGVSDSMAMMTQLEMLPAP